MSECEFIASEEGVCSIHDEPAELCSDAANALRAKVADLTDEWESCCERERARWEDQKRLAEAHELLVGNTHRLESLLAQERAKVAEQARVAASSLSAEAADDRDLFQSLISFCATRDAQVAVMREAVGRVCQDMTDWLAAENQLPMSQVGGAEAVAPWLEELQEAALASGGREEGKP